MEYQSFHYLMHKVPEAVKPVYVTGPIPLTFDELYSPRPRAIIHRAEKSYWRTRERIEYVIWEDRSLKLIIITCRSIEPHTVFRSIFVDAEKLYFEVESKARGSRDNLVKKKDKRIADDAALYKGCGDYLLARLNIKQEECPWPNFNLKTESMPSEQTVNSDEEATLSLNVSAMPMERMCTLDKLAGDYFDYLEVGPPVGISLEGIDFVKVNPTQGAIEDASVTTAISNDATTTAPAQGAVAIVTTATDITGASTASPTKSKPTSGGRGVTTKIAKGNKKKVVPIS